MKRELIRGAVMAAFLIVPLFPVLRCAGDDMALVTIELRSSGGVTAARPASWLDRIAGFLMRSAYAQAAPPVEMTTILTIEGNGMGTIVADISDSGSRAVIAVPAGKARVFTVQSHARNAVTGAALYDIGGRATADLSPGDNSISVRMLPVTRITDISYSTDGNIYVPIYWEQQQWPASVTPSVSHIYRSTDPGVDGELVFSQSTGQGYSITDIIPDPGPGIFTYYYRISLETARGEEGPKSDYAEIRATVP